MRDLCDKLKKEKAAQKREREELCCKIQCNNTNITNEIENGYETKLNSSLNDLSNQFKACSAGLDIIHNFVSVEQDWSDLVGHNRDSIGAQKDNYLQMKSKVQQQLMECMITRDKLIFERNGYKQKHEKNIDKIRRMKVELEALLHQYQDLSDIKLLLDFELAAYNKMLDIEEHCLNVSDLTKKAEECETLCESIGQTPTATKRKKTPSKNVNTKRDKCE